MKKKVLSLLLACVMLFSAFPTLAFGVAAADDCPYYLAKHHAKSYMQPGEYSMAYWDSAAGAWATTTDASKAVVAPTHEKGGWTQYICNICNRPFTDDATSKITDAHNFTELVLDKKEPTCTTDGNYAIYRCSACEKLAYMDKDGNLVPATASMTDAEILAGTDAKILAGHDNFGWPFVTDTRIATNSDAGAEFYFTFPELSKWMSFGNMWFGSGMTPLAAKNLYHTIAHVCEGCGKEFYLASTTSISTTGNPDEARYFTHSFITWNEETDQFDFDRTAFNTDTAKCYEDGKWYLVCEDCGIRVDITIIPNTSCANIHTWQDVKATVPTCSASGNIEYSYCTNCFTLAKKGDDGKRVVLTSCEGLFVATDTNYHKKLEKVSFTSYAAPSCTEAGNYSYIYCSVCKAYYLVTLNGIPTVTDLTAAGVKVEENTPYENTDSFGILAKGHNFYFDEQDKDEYKIEFTHEKNTKAVTISAFCTDCQMRVTVELLPEWIPEVLGEQTFSYSAGKIFGTYAESDIHGHMFAAVSSDANKIKEATCSEDGYALYQCIVCGYTPALDEEWELLVKATGETKGAREDAPYEAYATNAGDKNNWMVKKVLNQKFKATGHIYLTAEDFEPMTASNLLEKAKYIAANVDVLTYSNLFNRFMTIGNYQMFYPHDIHENVYKIVTATDDNVVLDVIYQVLIPQTCISKGLARSYCLCGCGYYQDVVLEEEGYLCPGAIKYTFDATCIQGATEYISCARCRYNEYLKAVKNEEYTALINAGKIAPFDAQVNWDLINASEAKMDNYDMGMVMPQAVYEHNSIGKVYLYGYTYLVPSTLKVEGEKNPNNHPAAAAAQIYQHEVIEHLLADQYMNIFDVAYRSPFALNATYTSYGVLTPTSVPKVYTLISNTDTWQTHAYEFAGDFLMSGNKDYFRLSTITNNAPNNIVYHFINYFPIYENEEDLPYATGEIYDKSNIAFYLKNFILNGATSDEIADLEIGGEMQTNLRKTVQFARMSTYTNFAYKDGVLESNLNDVHNSAWAVRSAVALCSFEINYLIPYLARMYYSGATADLVWFIEENYEQFEELGFEFRFDSDDVLTGLVNGSAYDVLSQKLLDYNMMLAYYASCPFLYGDACGVSLDSDFDLDDENFNKEAWLYYYFDCYDVPDEDDLWADCANGGHYDYYCEYCNVQQTTEENSFDGHDWKEIDIRTGLSSWNLYVAPGCNSDGHTTYYCTRCGAVKRDTLSALGHAYNEQPYSEATCAADKYVRKVCSRCGNSESPYAVTGTRIIVTAGNLYTDVQEAQKIHVSLTDADVLASATVLRQGNCTVQTIYTCVCPDCGMLIRWLDKDTGHHQLPTYGSYNKVRMESRTSLCYFPGYKPYTICTVCGKPLAILDGEYDNEKSVWVYTYEEITSETCPDTIRLEKYQNAYALAEWLYGNCNGQTNTNLINLVKKYINAVVKTDDERVATLDVYNALFDIINGWTAETKANGAGFIPTLGHKMTFTNYSVYREPVWKCENCGLHFLTEDGNWLFCLEKLMANELEWLPHLPGRYWDLNSYEEFAEFCEMNRYYSYASWLWMKDRSRWHEPCMTLSNLKSSPCNAVEFNIKMNILSGVIYVNDLVVAKDDGTVDLIMMHEYEYDHTETAATCIDPSVDTYKCKYCGDTDTRHDTIPLGHSYLVTNTNGVVESISPTATGTTISCLYVQYGVTYTDVKCERCTETYRLIVEHNWSPVDYATITCMNDEVKSRFCLDCGMTEIEYGKIRADGIEDWYHGQDKGIKTDTLDPTCEATGWVTKTCLDCGEVLVSEELPALGHTLLDDNKVFTSATVVIVTPSNCVDDAWYEVYCAACGKKLDTFQGQLPNSSDIPNYNDLKGYINSNTKTFFAQGHTLLVDGEIVDGTSFKIVTSSNCVANADVELYCTICGELLATAYGNVVTYIVDAGTIDAGIDEYTEYINLATYTDLFFAWEHSLLDADGNLDVNAIVWVTNTNCVADGYFKLVCTACGETVYFGNITREDIIYEADGCFDDLSGDEFDAYYASNTDLFNAHHTPVSETNAPMCWENQIVTYTCLVCEDYLYTDTFAPHVTIANVVDGKAQTNEVDGYRDYYCPVCMVTVTQIIPADNKLAYHVEMENINGRDSITDGSIVKFTITVTAKELAVWGMSFDFFATGIFLPEMTQAANANNAYNFVYSYNWAKADTDGEGFDVVTVVAYARTLLDNVTVDPDGEVVITLFYQVCNAEFSVGDDEDVNLFEYGIMPTKATNFDGEAVASTGFASTTTMAAFMDLDDNGSIDITDVLLAVKIAQHTAVYDIRADIDHDGDVEFDDVMAMVDYLTHAKGYEETVGRLEFTDANA